MNHLGTDPLKSRETWRRNAVNRPQDFLPDCLTVGRESFWQVFRWERKRPRDVDVGPATRTTPNPLLKSRLKDTALQEKKKDRLQKWRNDLTRLSFFSSLKLFAVFSGVEMQIFFVDGSGRSFEVYPHWKMFVWKLIYRYCKEFANLREGFFFKLVCVLDQQICCSEK